MTNDEGRRTNDTYAGLSTGATRRSRCEAGNSVPSVSLRMLSLTVQAVICYNDLDPSFDHFSKVTSQIWDFRRKPWHSSTFGKVHGIS
jgi:hypothetical protein